MYLQLHIRLFFVDLSNQHKVVRIGLHIQLNSLNSTYPLVKSSGQPLPGILGLDPDLDQLIGHGQWQEISLV